MTTRGRRGTYWAHVSEGATPLVLSAGGVSRLLLLSLREAETQREYEGYTVTRMILSCGQDYASGTQRPITHGVIVLPESVSIGDIDPATEPHVDWLWNEEFMVGSNITETNAKFTRDIRSQRKARGGDSELYWIVVNRGGVNLNVHRSGRILLRRA